MILFIYIFFSFLLFIFLFLHDMDFVIRPSKSVVNWMPNILTGLNSFFFCGVKQSWI